MCFSAVSSFPIVFKIELRTASHRTHCTHFFHEHLRPKNQRKSLTCSYPVSISKFSATKFASERFFEDPEQFTWTFVCFTTLCDLFNNLVPFSRAVRNNYKINATRSGTLFSCAFTGYMNFV